MFDLIRRVGESVEILSRTEVRYIGTLSSYDISKQTITLAKARSFGTENREAQVKIQESMQIYEYIVFKLANIQSVHENNKWIDIKTGKAIKPPQISQTRKKKLPKASNFESSYTINTADERHSFKNNGYDYDKSIAVNNSDNERNNANEKNNAKFTIMEKINGPKQAIFNPEEVFIDKAEISREKEKRRSKGKQFKQEICRKGSNIWKNAEIPKEVYDFNLNNKEMQKDTETEHYKKTYDPSFFYDSLS